MSRASEQPWFNSPTGRQANGKSKSTTVLLTCDIIPARLGNSQYSADVKEVSRDGRSLIPLVGRFDGLGRKLRPDYDECSDSSDRLYTSALQLATTAIA